MVSIYLSVADSDNVDRLYARKAPVMAAPAPRQSEGYTFQRVIQTQPDYRAPRRGQSPLTVILAAAPPVLAFTPQDEDKPMAIASLPLELFEPILARLDIGSLERFAQTCWQARSLTAKSPYWQRLVNRTYTQAVLDGQTCADLAERHAGDWRTTFIEEPRVRLDGCYISVCHYIRPGAGDEWVAITHMSESFTSRADQSPTTAFSVSMQTGPSCRS
jgi:F-box protein 9